MNEPNLTEAELDKLERACKASSLYFVADSKQFLALVAAARRSLAPWQPIETAPKDGTHVLLYWPTMSISSYPLVGFHHGDEYGWEPVADRDYGEIYPTHWMPLPEPPGKESENGPRDSSDPCSNGPDNAVVQPGDYIHLIPPPPLRLSADDLIRALDTANSKRRELETALDAARDLMSVIEQDTSLVRAWCDARAKAGKEASPLPSDVAALADRLRRLGQRREMEGIYTDRNICEAAAAKLQAQAAEIEHHKSEFRWAVNEANLRLKEIAALTERVERYRAALEKIANEFPAAGAGFGIARSALSDTKE